MRDPLLGITVALLVLTTAALIVMVAVTQPHEGKRYHNAYWPYSVETSVKDR